MKGWVEMKVSRFWAQYKVEAEQCYRKIFQAFESFCRQMETMIRYLFWKLLLE